MEEVDDAEEANGEDAALRRRGDAHVDGGTDDDGEDDSPLTRQANIANTRQLRRANFNISAQVEP